MEYPRAWEIAREAQMSEHDEECSYRWTQGALLCDCIVLTNHPEFLKDYGDDE